MTPQDPVHAIREITPGDHLCHVFETEGEYRSVLSVLLRQGLERGESVLCVLGDHGLEAVFADLRSDGVAVDDLLTRGHLRTVTLDEVFPRAGAIHSERMIALFKRESTRALAKGYTGLRVIGDMTWALSGFPGTDRLVEFETTLNASPSNNERSVICLYDRRRFPPGMLLQALATHPRVIYGGTIYENFTRAPMADTDVAARTLDHWLAHLASVTADREAEAVLRHSAQRHRTLYTKTPAMLHSIDQHYRLVDVSERWLDTLGYARDEVVGRRVTDFLTENSRAFAEQVALPQFMKTGVVESIPMQFQKKNGEIIDVLLSAVAERDADGRFLRSLTVLTDVTQQKRAEEELRCAHDELERRVGERTEQLRALSLHLLSVQEMERSRVAREIHDALGQALTALKIDIVWLEQHLPRQRREAQAKLRGMTDLVDETVQAVRRLATELRPRILDDLGLVAALEWHVREYQARTGLRCHFTCFTQDIALDTERATAVFRICQEALTNIVRHARATAVDIGLAWTGDTLVLEVRDNGRGIPPEATADPKSIGLFGMKERVLPWGGQVEIQGIPGQGTVVRVTLPLGAGKDQNRGT
jgi:PAS domain S-box-containing protein